MSDHTQGRLSQGRTLSTRITQRWSQEEWERNEARERCLVFADFTPIDEGRGRRLVAECHQGAEDARRLVACWNACEGMEDPETEVAALRKDSEYLMASERLRAQVIAQRDELLEALKLVLDDVGFGRCIFDTQASTMARAAIAKVEGKQ